MITPTATDLLRNIDSTLAEKVEPSLSDLTGRSALATVRHLLNFVRIRIDDEGQAMTDDIVAVRALLEKVGGYFRSIGDIAAADAVEAASAQQHAHDPAKYKSLNDLSAECGTLREAVHGSLATLQRMRADRGEDPQYKSIRSDIRTYLVAEIEREGEMVSKAFFGRGPRR